MSYGFWHTNSHRQYQLKKVESTAPLSEQQTGLVVLGKEYEGITPYTGIIPLLDKLVRLSPRDIRVVEGMVELMYAENDKK